MLGTVFTADETVEWFRRTLETQLVAALAQARAEAALEARRGRRAAALAKGAAVPAVVDAHRLDATPTIEVADWFADAPFATGESNKPTMLVPDGDEEPYEVETWQVLDDVATVRWLQRDAETTRVRWSESDEREIVIGRLRWIVDQAARKHRCTRRETVVRFPAARAAMQQAQALRARWHFQHEMLRAGVTPTPDTTRWVKAAFGRTYDIALDEIRHARRLSQRQAFAPVRSGLA